MVDLAALRSANAARWAKARLTRGPEFEKFALKAVANNATYKEIEARTGVPWVFVAVTHYRESTQDFSKSLAQGDPWDRVSTHVPAGRGPFKSFADAAVDALVNCAPYAARNQDWSIEGMLTYLERYNGLGYAMRGLPSPYLWSGTDQYQKGKYVADGKFDATVVDKQLGCAGLILAMMQHDPGITFDGRPIIVDTEPPKDAAWLQNALNKLGAAPVLTVDGLMGPATKAAVRAYQARKDLAVDGIAGPKTLAAIDADLSAAEVKVPSALAKPIPSTPVVAPTPSVWTRVQSFFSSLFG